MTQTIVTPDATPGTGRLGYQPALDGVRAIAIALVVLYHYPWGVRLRGVNPVHGGFLGVDVFFVLSGYLITTLLLQEHATFGHVSLRRFYARRALRLLPAFAVLWVIALVLHFTMPPGKALRPEWAGLLGTLFYAGNWVSIARPGALGILAHTFSLAIEEQFYLVWPVILIFLFRNRLRLPAIAALTAAGALASAGYRASYWRSHPFQNANFTNYYFRFTLRSEPVYTYPGSSHHFSLESANHLFYVWNRIYNGSDTQADSLLVGCFTAIVLVLVLPRLSSRVRTWLPVAACGALVAGAFIVARAYSKFSGWLPEWGFLALAVSTAVVITGLVAAPRSLPARVLALAPLAWIGRRSYAIYLFHQIVFWQCQRRRIHLSPPVSFVFQMVVILVVAELSFRLVEAPMLRRKRNFEPRLARE